MHAVGAKAMSYVEADAEIQDLKSYIEGDLELTFDAVISDPDAPTLDVSASEVRTSKKVSDPEASSCAKTLSKKGKNPTQLSTSASQIQKLDFLQVFKYPLGTESAIKAMLECNTLVFVVDKRADKKIIREAAKNMFKIRVKKVNTSMTPDGTKKAYLMLARDCNAADVAKKIKIL